MEEQTTSTSSPQTAAGSSATDKIKIQYYRSSIGYSKKQKQIVQSLGLRKLNQIVERPDNPSVRGVVLKVPHLLRIVE